MDLRLASTDDLPGIKAVYGKIVEAMYRDGIFIWDEIYPCEFLEDDVKGNCLYILQEANGDVVAAFALCETNAGADHVKWGNAQGRALYLDRFGVNADYARRGVGSIMLKHAAALAHGKGAEYLRLFVVDGNRPAVDFYLKNGFRRVPGCYNERVDDDLVLHEYGFELAVHGDAGA